MHAPTEPGTEISVRRTLDDYPVKALSAISAQAMITVAGRGLLGVPGVAARTFATLSEHGMSVSLITQSSSEAQAPGAGVGSGSEVVFSGVVGGGDEVPEHAASASTRANAMDFMRAL